MLESERKCRSAEEDERPPRTCHLVSIHTNRMAQCSSRGTNARAWKQPRLTPGSRPSSIHLFTCSPIFFFYFSTRTCLFSHLNSLAPCHWEQEERKMSSLDTTRAELGLVVLYLNKAEARDKICRAIQYGSKFISNGQPGTAQNVDRSTTLARKVFRLLKWVNDLHALISPPAKGTPLTLVLLGKSKNALLSTFLFLDQFVWAGRSGIIKNKEGTDRVAWLSLYCWMASSVCAGLVELGELKRLSKSMRKLARELRATDKYENEQYRSKMKQSDERLLALVKAAMDVVVAIGLLQLAPKKVTPRVTGAFGFITSLISCYQQLPSRAPVPKVKA